VFLLGLFEIIFLLGNDPDDSGEVFLPVRKKFLGA
jgi:hypothetical protein